MLQPVLPRPNALSFLLIHAYLTYQFKHGIPLHLKGSALLFVLTVGIASATTHEGTGYRFLGMLVTEMLRVQLYSMNMV